MAVAAGFDLQLWEYPRRAIGKPKGIASCYGSVAGDGTGGNIVVTINWLAGKGLGSKFLVLRRAMVGTTIADATVVAMHRTQFQPLVAGTWTVFSLTTTALARHPIEGLPLPWVRLYGETGLGVIEITVPNQAGQNVYSEFYFEYWDASLVRRELLMESFWK